MAGKPNIPLDVVIAIHEAPGPQKEIAQRYGVSVPTVCQIKRGVHHRAALQRHYADKVRAEYAILAAAAACPSIVLSVV